MARLVAVADGDKTYAGYDGGPARGGTGRWRVGQVGEWSADYPPPMAKRDPSTGMIWTGWLEECEDIARKDDGTLVCLKSKKVMVRPPTPEELRAKPRQYYVVGDTMRPLDMVETVTPEAEARAENGPPPLRETLTPSKRSRQPRPANAPPHAGRPSDNPVG